MKKDLTEIVCVLDRSGSMSALQQETITKFNEFIKEQREVPGDAQVTVVLFDDKYEVLHQGVDIKELPELTSKEYFARGWTRLNDAIGKTILDVGGRLNKLPEGERPEKVILVVITDGAENYSVEFPGDDGRRKVKEMVEHQREKYSWEILFLGANIDAISTGLGYGAMKNMCANFAASGQGVGSAYSATGSRVKLMRCSSSLSYGDMPDLDDETEK